MKIEKFITNKTDALEVASRPVHHSEEECVAALARIQSTPEYQPVSALIPTEIAPIIEPYLKGLTKFAPTSRTQCYRLLKELMRAESYQLSKYQLSQKLNFPHYLLYHIERTWPNVWRVAALLATHELQKEEFRVDQATHVAAIHGNDRDRRLFYELRGKLKQRGDGSNKTIIFVNDVLNRPQPKEIEIKGEVVRDE